MRMHSETRTSEDLWQCTVSACWGKETTKLSHEDMNRHFTTEDVWMANKHMKRHSTLLVVKEMRMKATMIYNFTPIRMVLIKKTDNTNVGEDMEKQGPSHTAGGNVNDAILENNLKVS